jgi:hypothetical protein
VSTVDYISQGIQNGNKSYGTKQKCNKSQRTSDKS